MQCSMIGPFHAERQDVFRTSYALVVRSLNYQSLPGLLSLDAIPLGIAKHLTVNSLLLSSAQLLVGIGN